MGKTTLVRYRGGNAKRRDHELTDAATVLRHRRRLLVNLHPARCRWDRGEAPGEEEVVALQPAARASGAGGGPGQQTHALG